MMILRDETDDIIVTIEGIPMEVIGLPMRQGIKRAIKQ